MAYRKTPCEHCGAYVTTNAMGRAAHYRGRDCSPEIQRRKGAGLIDYRDAPQYFLTDSIERGIFQPYTDTHCRPADLEALYSDAKWYAEGRRTHDAPHLDWPAKAVVRWIEKHAPAVARKFTTTPTTGA